MKRHLLYLSLIIVLFIVTASAQDNSSDDESPSLWDKGSQAYDNKDYRKAIDYYLEASSDSEYKDWRHSLFYQVACCYSLLGEADRAFEYLDSAVAAGLTDYDWTKADPDFDILRERHGAAFDDVLERIKATRSVRILEKTPVAIVEYENYNGPLDVSDYEWEDIDRPEMDTLRTRYQLREVIGDDGTEFDKMKRLLNWVSTRWKHDGSKMATTRTALAILREVNQGKRFCCANYADVLIDCMRALGYTIRFAGLKTEDAAYNMGGGHGCVEVWSNQYQKWILLDAQNNAWWEHDNIPLSAYECHLLFTSGKEDELEFIGQHEGYEYDRAKPTWVAHFYRVNSYWMGEDLYLASDAVTPGVLCQLNPDTYVITDQFDKVYPRLNQTTITLLWDEGVSLDSVSVTLAHTMPYFDRFMVRFDESDWIETEDSMVWVLNEGLSVIEAKAVNSAGIEGRPSRIVLLRNIDSSD